MYFAQSPTLPASATFTTGTYTIPALPAGATAISVGLSIYDVGSITMDAYTLVDTDTTPPAVALTAPTDGASVAGTVTVTATATDAGGVDHVDFLVDGTVVGTARGTFAISWDTTHAPDSTVGLVARAVDLAGNEALSPGHLITIANTPPPDTTPPVVAVTAPGEGAVVTGVTTLRATATDNVAVQHVDFLVDDQLVASSDTAPFTGAWDTSTVTSGDVAVTARASDSAGNSTTSAAIHVSVDRAAPAVAITSPSTGAQLSGVVAVSADASDDIGVASVELFANGASLGVVAAPPYAVSWDTSTVPDGAVTLTAVATDRTTARTTSAPIAVSVSNGVASDTTPPVSAITCDGGPCSAAFANHAVTIALAASDAGSGVATIAFSLDGGAAQTYSGPFSLAATAAIAFHAVDRSGNVEATHAQTVRVDTTAPVTTITCNDAPCVAGFYAGPVTIALAATDAGSGVASIRAGSVTYTGPFVVPASTTLVVQAIDVAGNAEAPQSLPIAIDATAPAVSIACNGAACASTFSNQPIAITLSAATTGASGVAAIRYTLDGSTPTLSTGLAYATPFAVGATTTIRFAAFSGAGVSSAVGSQLVQIDTTAPTASISSPLGGNVTGTTPIVAVVSDDIAVVRVRFYLDGKQLGTRTATPFRWNWDTTTSTKGSHAIAIQAEDAAGNATRSASITVTVQ